MGIQSKLFLAFLSASIIIVGAMYGFMQWSIDRGLLSYLNQKELEQQQRLVPKLSALYAQTGDWSSLKENRRLWHRLLTQSADPHYDDSNSLATETQKTDRGFEAPYRREPRGERHRPPPRFAPPYGRPPHFEQRQRPPRFPDANARPEFRSTSEGTPDSNPAPPRRSPPRIVLLDVQKQPIFGDYDGNDKFTLIPVKVDGETVGWLTSPPHKRITDDFDLSFVETQNTTYLLISLALILVSACIAVPLSARLVKPIKEIASASHKLASGQFSTRVDEGRSDEIGQLTRDFNQLATTLEANESSRKRWIADISHELRTPLAVTRGELEAMLDKIRPMNHDNVASAHQEVLHLQRLVNDLYELTNADIGALTYHKTWLDIAEIVENESLKFKPRMEQKGITLSIHVPEEEIGINADETRITQLIHNLLQNSIKYTDPDGVINLSLTTSKKWVTLSIEDSKPGVPPDDLSKLFDHLYRAEASRNRKTGGSGLGLAICQRIVEGHGGNIKATLSDLGGLCMTVRLPL